MTCEPLARRSQSRVINLKLMKWFILFEPTSLHHQLLLLYPAETIFHEHAVFSPAMGCVVVADAVADEVVAEDALVDMIHFCIGDATEVLVADKLVGFVRRDGLLYVLRAPEGFFHHRCLQDGQCIRSQA